LSTLTRSQGLASLPLEWNIFEATFAVDPSTALEQKKFSPLTSVELTAQSWLSSRFTTPPTEYAFTSAIFITEVAAYGPRDAGFEKRIVKRGRTKVRVDAVVTEPMNLPHEVADLLTDARFPAG
jgi:hypothetical protein